MAQDADHTTLDQARKAYEDFGNIRMDQSHSTETAYVDALEKAYGSSQAEIARLREALDEIGGLSRYLRQGGPDPMDLAGLSDGLSRAVDAAHGALSEGK